MKNPTNEVVKEAMLKLLKISEEQYFFMQVDYATEYLQSVLGIKQTFVKVITESKLFWNWWLHHWYDRDLELLNCIKPDVGTRMTYMNTYPQDGKYMCEWDVIDDQEDLLDFYRFKHAPFLLKMHLSYKLKNEMVKEVTGGTVVESIVKEYSL